MKTITINRTSWHYRMMETCQWTPREADNLCHYIRKFVELCFILFLFAIVAMFYLVSMGEIFAWISWMILNQAWIEPDPFSFLGLLVIAMVLCVAGYLGWVVVYEKFTEERQELLNAVWDTIHDKVCFRVVMK